MKKNVVDFDLSKLSLEELVTVYKQIEEFVTELDEKVKLEEEVANNE